LFSNFTFFYSNYDYALAFGEDDLDKFTWDSAIRNIAFKPELSYFINPENKLTFGGEILRYDFEPANAPEKQALEASIYIGNDQKIGSKITLQYGIRYSNFRLLGAGNEFEFADVPAGFRRPVTNITTFDRGETIQSYGNLEPRFSIKYQLNEASSIKASYNRMTQYIHLISNTTASNPLDIWIPSTNNVLPEIGDQVAVGYFRNFGENNDFETSAEV